MIFPLQINMLKINTHVIFFIVAKLQDLYTTTTATSHAIQHIYKARARKLTLSGTPSSSRAAVTCPRPKRVRVQQPVGQGEGWGGGPPRVWLWLTAAIINNRKIWPYLCGRLNGRVGQARFVWVRRMWLDVRQEVCYGRCVDEGLYKLQSGARLPARSSAPGSPFSVVHSCQYLNPVRCRVYDMCYHR